MWLPRKCDYRTDSHIYSTHTYRQTQDKVIPMCSYAPQVTQKQWLTNHCNKVLYTCLKCPVTLYWKCMLNHLLDGLALQNRFKKICYYYDNLSQQTYMWKCICYLCIISFITLLVNWTRTIRPKKIYVCLLSQLTCWKKLGSVGGK